jgi:DNA-binding LacI/PurR family transcriptional regulator
VVHLRSEHTKWCAATGIDHVEICTEGVVTHEAAAIGALLDDGVDAVFTAAESVQTALDVVVERGLEVGRDVLIATLDDDIDGSLAQRGITTVGLNGRNYAEDVVAALVDIVEGRLQPPVVVPAQLTVHPRATTNGRP